MIIISNAARKYPWSFLERLWRWRLRAHKPRVGWEGATKTLRRRFAKRTLLRVIPASCENP